MEMKDEVARLESVKERLSQGGGPEAIKKQRAAGKLTAWERMELLFDPGTFQELDLMAKSFRTGFEIDSKETPEMQ